VCFGVIFGRCLLISGSKVRVLDGPPILSGASVIAGAPDLLLVSNVRSESSAYLERRGALVVSELSGDVGDPRALGSKSDANV
jgi:hypothetical protein